MRCLLEWIAHTLHQTHGRRAGIRTVPFYGRAMRGNLGISREIRPRRDVLPGSLRCRSRMALWTTWQQPTATFETIVCTRGPNRCGNDGYYEVFLHVCLYSRSSRLLWGSGNARQNRMDEGRGVGAGFPNQDSPDVGVLENRWIASQRVSKDPKPSTEGDGRYAMLLWWMGGNLGADRSWSGEDRKSTRLNSSHSS